MLVEHAGAETNNRIPAAQTIDPNLHGLLPLQVNTELIVHVLQICACASRADAAVEAAWGPTTDAQSNA